MTEGLRTVLSWLAPCLLAAATIHPGNLRGESTPDTSPALLNDGPGGATCSDYDRATGVHWRHRLGDWRDTSWQPQGERAFAKADVADTDTSRHIEFDVTAIVDAWRTKSPPDFGILLRSIDNRRGTTTFHSREAIEPEVRPRLLLTLASGGVVELEPAADTYLSCSTVQSLGGRKTLEIGVDSNAMLVFAPKTLPDGIVRAVLRLTTTDRQHGATVLGAYVIDPPWTSVASSPVLGLAAGYPGDVGIERNPDVLLFENFESSTWARHWSDVGDTSTIELVTRDPELRFEPLRANALRVNVAKGAHLGLNVTYRFRDKIGKEPDEIYFRYYVRLAADWRPTRDGGKFPGIAGTYGRAGWGGRKADGTNGWSMRGGFEKIIEPPHPLAGQTPIGTYAYLPGTPGAYGEPWQWSLERPGTLANNRWYCIEQHAKLNTPGRDDGVLQVWIDGIPAFERHDIRARDVSTLHIDEIWLNVYHGGTAVSPYDQHLYIDNVVIARSYIGPMTDVRGAISRAKH